MESSAFWDRILGSSALAWGAKPSPAVELLAAHLPAPARVLVPGCGYGRNALGLARHGYEVVATDGSLAGLERARSEFAHRGIRYLHEDVFTAPDGPFDAVLSHYVLHLFRARERARLLTIWRNALRASGLLMLTALSTRCSFFGQGEELEPGTWSNPGWLPIHFETPETLAAQLEQCGLTVLKTEEREEPEDKPTGPVKTPTVYALASR